MKQKDIALIAVLVIISGMMSFFVSRMLFSADKRQMTAEVVDAITSDFPTPPKKYFNANSIDLTQLIQIGGANNQNPFSGRQQQ